MKATIQYTPTTTKIAVRVVDPYADMLKWEFLTLCKLYSHHYHEVGDSKEGCFVCEGFTILDGGQFAVSEMLSGRDRQYQEAPF